MDSSSGPHSQTAESEAASQPGEELPVAVESYGPMVAAFPPYPPYAVPPAPPSVADTIIAGRDLRLKHKTALRKPARPPPRPAGPRGPKATDVKLTRRALKAQARCLRCHGTVLTDRLERISKPQRRKIIYLWREYAHMFPAETVARLRAMLDADEPFKPDQAYEYFFNLKKGKKKNAANARVNEIKKDILSMYGEKRFLWARNATVAFARGIQQRLAKSGRYELGDGMLRLSNIILDEICGYMHMKTPSRLNHHRKQKFMVELADKIAVWIDEILAESDDRMLMMDFDEDEDIIGPGGDAKFEDDFLDMMGGAGRRRLLTAQPAYLRFKGPMLDAFNILTDSMQQKNGDQLISHGKFSQTYAEAADELKKTTVFGVTDFSLSLANELNENLTETSKPSTPSELEPYMKDMVDICSKHLSQNAEYNKDKGPAFKLLVETMKNKPDDELFQKEKIKKTYGQAAKDLEAAKGLETDHEDPILANDILTKLKNTMEEVTPADLKTDMEETMDMASKYMSQSAVDEIERGPAFDILIKELERDGAEPFYDSAPLATQFAAAYTLKSAPGLSNVKPDPKTAPIFSDLLHDVVDVATPLNLQQDMKEVIERCANYLSAFTRDRAIVTKQLLEMMKSKPQEEFASTPMYTMDYSIGAQETETAPNIIPYLPIKDIADTGKKILTKDMEKLTKKEHEVPMKALISDVAKHLSQPVALRGGVAGERYPLEFLTAVKKSLGKRPLYKYKGYGQTYADAASSLRLAGPLDVDTRPSAMELEETIESEMQKGVPVKIAPTIVKDLNPTIESAAKHLANVGATKGKTMEQLVGMMKEKGETPLAQLQGYQQTYDDGARRLENAPSLKRSTVEMTAYETVKKKLDKMAKDKPGVLTERQAEHLPDLIDETSKYLSAPVPETAAEKREVLADLLGRGGDKIIAHEASYKMTHVAGGEEIKKAKVGVTTAKDETKKKEIQAKVEALIPDQKMQELLKDPVQEGAAHLADTVKGRGEALEVVKGGLKKEKEKNLIALGDFKETHEGGAHMLATAPRFEVKEPPPSIVQEVVAKRIEDAIPETVPVHIKKEHMDDAKEIASKYIAKVAVEQSGVDPKTLKGMDLAAFEAAEAQKLGIETEAQRKARLEREEAERLAREAERLARLEAAQRGDRDQLAAKQLLIKELKQRGDEVFYEQPHTILTHKQAAENLSSPPSDTDKKMTGTSDSARLHKKFEKKLNSLVAPVTPSELSDAMQDAVIEGAQLLSDLFVASNYKAQAGVALISEMQKHGNEILVEVDGKTETTFFAAQRLKKAKELKTDVPCTEVAPRLNKRLDELMRQHSMPRKLAPTVKEHTKEAADYLSPVVTKPEPGIEAYVTLLQEMEAAGETALVEGDIPKTHKDAASYLRQLTTFEDKINLPNPALHKNIKDKLHTVITEVSPVGYTKSTMSNVITDTAGLLTSHMMNEAEKTEALKRMVKHMDEAGNNVLLRHGNVRKSFKDGADLLRGKNTGQLSIVGADPVVARKLEIKLHNLMQYQTPEKYVPIMNGVIEDATQYLGVHLLEPQIIKVCKCMNNAFVQCELWCDEILRRVAKPPCTCSRHISTQDVQDLGPTPHLQICPGSSRAFPPGLEIAITECPSKPRAPEKIVCPASKPTPECDGNPTTSYLLHSAVYRRNYDSERPTRIPPQTSLGTSGLSLESVPAITHTTDTDRSSTVKNLIRDLHLQNIHLIEKSDQRSDQSESSQERISDLSYKTHQSRSRARGRPAPQFHHAPTTMFTKVHSRDSIYLTPLSSSLDVEMSESTFARNRNSYSSRAPIVMVSTDQMADWHAMMVSLMWNVQAWQKWIQENIDQGLTYQYNSDSTPEEAKDSWIAFHRRVSTEALQWRQYNIFSRRLTVRLVSRYSDKVILSPSRYTVRTDSYDEIARDMISIIDMFAKWTQWLILVIKETDSMQLSPDSTIPLHAMCWYRYKNNISEYAEDWDKYNSYLNMHWEQKYQRFIANYAPKSSASGPVWVVSTCGAVPSGAVAAGIYDGEIIWIARTTHKCNVLPAALHPSKHCCLVYTDGAVYHYTKYQVMCNAEVNWVPWRGGSVANRAVRIAEGVYIGRVHYRGSHLVGPVHAPQFRCHVVIFGRPFAFNCYELLVLAPAPSQELTH